MGEAVSRKERERLSQIAADLKRVSTILQPCLRPPIPEIFNAARYLDAAVSAHTASKRALADEAFCFQRNGGTEAAVTEKMIGSAE